MRTWIRATSFSLFSENRGQKKNTWTECSSQGKARNRYIGRNLSQSVVLSHSNPFRATTEYLCLRCHPVYTKTFTSSTPSRTYFKQLVPLLFLDSREMCRRWVQKECFDADVPIISSWTEGCPRPYKQLLINSMKSLVPFRNLILSGHIVFVVVVQNKLPILMEVIELFAAQITLVSQRIKEVGCRMWAQQTATCTSLQKPEEAA